MNILTRLPNNILYGYLPTSKSLYGKAGVFPCFDTRELLDLANSFPEWKVQIYDLL